MDTRIKIIFSRNINPIMKTNSLFICLFLGLLFSCSRQESWNFSQNNLNKETSPYLLQHAQNPVHWQPWNESRYENQNKAEKLLIVSIGYSSCHWCHVMEEETFEDKTVAAVMNKNFINIKVDREENPDVDNIYMTAVQLLTGRGGWPLNVICLPNGTPIYGGTYHTRAQWIQILERVRERYENNPEQLEDLAKKVAEGIAAVNVIELPEDPKPFDETFFEKPVKQWEKNFDLIYGGEIGKQKFIRPSKFHFLRQYHELSKKFSINEYIETSLQKIATSGVYDALEGGFFRYSVDPYWKVPHFEKMLYDNAQMVGLYAEAFKSDANPIYRLRVEETIAFLKNRMAAKGGGFYSAIDADNEAGEGRYYVFTKKEIEKIATNQIEMFKEYYGIDFNDPFEEDFFILKKAVSESSFVRSRKLKTKEWNQIKSDWDKKIFIILSQRDFPGIDTKIITSWNALTIIGFVEAAQAFDNQAWLQEAETLFDFLIKNTFVDGKFYHTLQNGIPKIDGFLEDYAYMAGAALALYKTTGKKEYLDWSQTLVEKSMTDFKDANSPFFTFKSSNHLLSPILSVDDGVMPSANAFLANVLSDLGHLLARKDYLNKVEKMLQAIQPILEESISDYCHWASLLAKWTYPEYEVIIAGPEANSMTKEIQKKYLVNVLFQFSTTPSDLPLLKERYFEEETYIYVCQNNVCLRPETTVEAALKQLEEFENQVMTPDPSNSFF